MEERAGAGECEQERASYGSGNCGGSYGGNTSSYGNSSSSSYGGNS
jgi:hypothetical protein